MYSRSTRPHSPWALIMRASPIPRAVFARSFSHDVLCRICCDKNTFQLKRRRITPSRHVAHPHPISAAPTLSPRSRVVVQITLESVALIRHKWSVQRSSQERVETMRAINVLAFSLCWLSFAPLGCDPADADLDADDAVEMRDWTIS